MGLRQHFARVHSHFRCCYIIRASPAMSRASRCRSNCLRLRSVSGTHKPLNLKAAQHSTAGVWVVGRAWLVSESTGEPWQAACGGRMHWHWHGTGECACELKNVRGCGLNRQEGRGQAACGGRMHWHWHGAGECTCESQNVRGSGGRMHWHGTGECM
jgi:hypothetical protein